MKNTDFLTITSRSNPAVVRYSKLKDKKFRDQELIFLADGVKLTREALVYSSVENLLVREDVVDLPEIGEILLLAKEKNTTVTVLSSPAFEKISSESSPQGIIAAVRADAARHRPLSEVNSEEIGKTVMLSEIMDPGNLGTVLRCAAAFGFDSVIVSRCADIYNPKTVRASMGAVFKMNIYSADDPESAVALLRNHRRVFAAALAENTLTLGEFDVKADDVFVIGNEGHGLPESVISACSASVKIPIASNTESLNAAVAATVLMWEQYRH